MYEVGNNIQRIGKKHEPATENKKLQPPFFIMQPAEQITYEKRYPGQKNIPGDKCIAQVTGIDRTNKHQQTDECTEGE